MNTNTFEQSTSSVKDQKESHQNIELVNGEFSLNEANEVVLALLDQKLNFHKTKKFQLWTRNNNADFATLDKRIAELEKEKEIAEQFLKTHQGTPAKLRLDANLKISVID